MLTYVLRRWTFKFKCTSPWESIWFWVSFFTKNDYKKLGYIFKSVLFNRLIVDYKVSLFYTSLILIIPLFQGIVFNRWEFGLQAFLFHVVCSVIILIIPWLEVIVLNRDGTLEYEVLFYIVWSSSSYHPLWNCFERMELWITRCCCHTKRASGQTLYCLTETLEQKALTKV